MPSDISFPKGTRERVGLSPNNPQLLAGIRIEPALSVACAAGYIPLASASALPPLEPPDLLDKFYGLLVGPKRLGSVEMFTPSSGVFVLPKITSPPV